MGLFPSCLAFRARFRLLIAVGLLTITVLSTYSLLHSFALRSLRLPLDKVRAQAGLANLDVDNGRAGSVDGQDVQEGQFVDLGGPANAEAKGKNAFGFPELPANLRMGAGPVGRPTKVESAPEAVAVEVVPQVGAANDDPKEVEEVLANDLNPAPLQGPPVVAAPPQDPRVGVGHPAFHNPAAPFDPPNKFPEVAHKGDFGGAGAGGFPKPLTVDELMRLPILPHPPRKERPIPAWETPWDYHTERGSLVLDLLSPKRFPFTRDEGQLGWKGMEPPPVPVYPDPSVLLPRGQQFSAPIALQDVYGLLTAKEGGRSAAGDDDWWERPKRAEWDPKDADWKPKKMPKVQWKGFSKPGWETESQKKEREQRRDWVRRGFAHVWEGYKRVAWGHDELRPVSGTTEDPFSGWGATLVDSLDTLLIMNLTHEYNYARTHVRAIDWSHTVDAKRIGFGGRNRGQALPMEPTIPFFETVIRYVGGLLGAYDLSGDQLMLTRVEELARWLLPAFGTSSGLPGARYQLGNNPRGSTTRRVCLAETGSLVLEFTRLAQLTGNAEYFHVVQRITDVLDSDDWNSQTRVGALFPTFIDPEHPSNLGGTYTMGAMADSYYEYIIKVHQLMSGTLPQYSRMYGAAVDSVHEFLIKEIEVEPIDGPTLGPPGTTPAKNGLVKTVLGDLSYGNFVPRIEHLACFAAGMLALGGKLLGRQKDFVTGEKLTDTCVWSYESTPSGCGSEWVNLFREEDRDRWMSVTKGDTTYRQLRNSPRPGWRATDGRYLGRPETIESVLYLWRTTGDRQWQDRGWRMFTSWMEAAITPSGFADLSSVHAERPIQLDKEESFVLAETFKYYYLLFSEPDYLSLDDFVFNTEAHPFRIPKRNAFSAKEEGKVDPPYLWEGPEPELDAKYDPPSAAKAGRESGWGTFIQMWAKADPNEVIENDVEMIMRPPPQPMKPAPGRPVPQGGVAAPPAAAFGGLQPGVQVRPPGDGIDAVPPAPGPRPGKAPLGRKKPKRPNNVFVPKPQQPKADPVGAAQGP